MPEGDTIHRTASALRTALVDHKMIRFEAPRLVGVVPRAGRTIERVESHGKHLEIEWDDGVILHTHMRMSGSWHVYRLGEPWQRPHREMRVVIETETWVAVCFNAPTVETYRSPGLSRHPGLGRLGPDLCRVDADLDRCAELMLSYDDPRASISEVLLDQRVFCGVGNVYRCEVLWACELSPRAPVGELSESLATRLVSVAARLLRANLNTAAARRPARRPRWARRLRAQRSAVLPLQRHGAGPACRRVQPPPLLVPRLSDPAGSAAAGPRHADRPAPRRQAVRRRTHLADRLTHDRRGSAQLRSSGGARGAEPPVGDHSLEMASRTFIRLALLLG